MRAIGANSFNRVASRFAMPLSADNAGGVGKQLEQRQGTGHEHDARRQEHYR
jgi:hypothetical protein